MKKRILVIALAMAVMLMGAGYAYWTDQTELTNVVRTGDFGIEFTQARAVTDDADWDEHHNNYSFDWTNLVQQSFNGNTAYIDVKDMYPGGMVRIDLTQKNIGSIPAKLESIDVHFVDGDWGVYSNLQAQTAFGADINGDGKRDVGSIHVGDWKDWFGVEKAIEEELMNELNKRNIVIEPDGSIWLDGEEGETGCVTLRLNPEVGNDLQNKYCKFAVTFNWKQWSTDPGANGYNTYGGDGEDTIIAD